MAQTRRHRTPIALSRPPLERMKRIHERLLTRTYPNCRQLADEIEVSTKTIQRDIEFMRDRLDLPIEFDSVRNGYYFNGEVSSFPTVQVTEGEMIALFVAEKALAQYRGTPFEKPLHAAFQKLTDGLRDRVTFSWSDLDHAISFHAIGTTVADMELFNEVNRAVCRSQELEFEYKKLNSAGHEKRTIHPYHLGCIENQWYLFGFDLARNGMRTFVLPRMRKVRNTGTRFVRPADFSVTKHLAGSFGVFQGGKPELIRIRFDSFAAQLVRERTWHQSQKIKDLPHGEIELTVKLANTPEIFRWILSWGEHAQVLAPDHLRTSLRATAQKLADAYG
jgi:predicted DNA-binding transcriptional regulator YafY